MKHFGLLLAIALLGCTALSAADKVTGLWKIIDDKTKKPNAIAMIYEHQGKLYGRILVSIDTKTGNISDTIAQQKDKSKNMVGEPPICGMDFIYQLEDKGKEWYGSIVDPEPGDEYDCVIKKNGANLNVRGQLRGFGIFGRDQVWMPASQSDLPEGITLPDAATLIPKIPKHK